MKEEELFQKIGKENPFSTPDGYFENLTSDVMQHLPEKELPKGPEQVTMRDKLRPYFYLAAIFVGAALIIKVLNYQKMNDPEYIAEQEAKYETEVISNVMDDTLMDEYSLYLYLADADE